MFRDGQYLEVIKVSNDCLATAVVTVQEKAVEIKKRKVTTNKWLQVEDWAALYKILERAVLRNGRGGDGSQRDGHGCECRKSTRQLEVTYSFEPSESISDTTSLPTIKVHVSPARKRSVKRKTDGDTSKRIKAEAGVEDAVAKLTEERSPDRTTDINRGDRLKNASENPARISPRKPDTSPRTIAEQEDHNGKNPSPKYVLLYDDLENAPFEEYIPDAPKAKRPCPDLKYVPSRKSALMSMRSTSDEYMPTPCADKHVADIVTCYVPNSIEKRETIYETYEPRAITTIPDCVLEGYVPNSKGIKPSIEEYEPDFKSPNKMTFDDSYVPSCVRQNSPCDSKRTPDKLKMQRLEARRKGTPIKKRTEDLFL